MSENLKELKQIIPFKWRVQSIKNGFAVCVPYIKSKDVMDLLDDVIGVENWTIEYKEVKTRLYCRISIKVGNEWVYKEGVGVAPEHGKNEHSKVKGEASDALKLAGQGWGIGRFLKEVPTQILKTKTHPENNNKEMLLDSNGKELKENYLTTYLNGSKKVIDVIHSLNSKYIVCNDLIKPTHSENSTIKNDIDINIIIEEIKNAQTLGELRIIRKLNENLENSNDIYKQALKNKLNELTSKNADKLAK